MLRSMAGKWKAVQCLAPGAAVTADTNMTAVDTKDFGSACILVDIGAQTFTTNNKIAIEVEESDNGTDWTDAPAGAIVDEESAGVATTLVAGAGSQVVAVHYIGMKRYFRGVLNISGTISCVIGALAIKGNPQAMPPL